MGARAGRGTDGECDCPGAQATYLSYSWEPDARAIRELSLAWGDSWSFLVICPWMITIKSHMDGCMIEQYNKM